MHEAKPLSAADSSTSSEVAAAKPRPAGTRFRFRITLEGLMLLVVILLIGFAAWHSGTNLLYLIFSILVALYLVHGFLLSINLGSLSITETFPETAIANQPFDVTVNVANEKKYAPTNAIRVTHSLDKRSAPLGSVYLTEIPRRESRESYYTTLIPRRGLYTVSTVALSTRYPFGFEERSQLRPSESHILVLPPTYGVASIAANIPFGFGDQDSTVRGTGTELYGLREYVPGEHARHVHWRTSARAAKVMIAEFTRDERRQIMLLLNNGVMSELRDNNLNEEFEKAVVLTASLARHLINSGFEIGLTTLDYKLQVGQGPSHLLAIMRHLATVELVEPLPLPRTDGTILEIAFHSTSQRTEQNNNVLTINSYTWEPPKDYFSMGDK